MALGMLQQIKQQVSALTVEDQLQLIAYLAESVRRSGRPRPICWTAKTLRRGFRVAGRKMMSTGRRYFGDMFY